jgi:hypothetical protein
MNPSPISYEHFAKLGFELEMSHGPSKPLRSSQSTKVVYIHVHNNCSVLNKPKHPWHHLWERVWQEYDAFNWLATSTPLI